MGTLNTRTRRIRPAGSAAASSLAAAVAAFVGSEFLEGARKAKDERSLLANLSLTVLFGLLSVWELLQVRQHLGLTPELYEDEDGEDN